MDPDIKGKWLKALRSGEYKQGGGMLHPDPHTYCCLGVLCDLHAKETGGVWVRDGHEDSSYEGMNALLPVSVYQWAGFGDPEYPNDVDLLVSYDGHQEYLSTLNDYVLTFAEIADLIEEQL